MLPLLLHTQKLAIGYQHQSIASGIQIALSKGELVSLIGPNGIGKSTLLRTISGLQQPITGDIFIKEKPLASYSRNEKARLLSVVLTDKLPHSNLTVYELVAAGRQPYTNWIGTLSFNDKKVIQDSIDLAGIAHLADKKVHQISDGQLQTAMISRALAQDTDLIILDEPATHLDIIHKAFLLKLLQQLTMANKAILFSTHDIDMALQASTCMISMTSAEILQETPADFIKNKRIEAMFGNSSATAINQKLVNTVKDL